jgi:hypothetical protein
MAEWVDVLVLNEHYAAADRLILHYLSQYFLNRVLSVGEADHGKRLFDVPIAALEKLRESGVPFETRPRDPRKPLPN